MSRQIAHTICIDNTGESFPRQIEVDSSLSDAQIISLVYKDSPFVEHVTICSRS